MYWFGEVGGDGNGDEDEDEGRTCIKYHFCEELLLKTRRREELLTSRDVINARSTLE